MFFIIIIIIIIIIIFTGKEYRIYSIEERKKMLEMLEILPQIW